MDENKDKNKSWVQIFKDLQNNLEKIQDIYKNIQNGPHSDVLDNLQNTDKIQDICKKIQNNPEYIFDKISVGDYKIIRDRLENLCKKLMEINRNNGTTERYELMKEEIKTIGWPAIVQKYHPDVNIDDPAAHELFRFYKYTYDKLKSDGEI